jgi:hypothetical protein
VLNEIIALLKNQGNQINHLKLYVFRADKEHFRNYFDLVKATVQPGHDFTRSDLIKSFISQ